MIHTHLCASLNERGDGGANRQLVKLSQGCVNALHDRESWVDRPPPIVAPGADPNGDFFTKIEDLLERGGVVGDVNSAISKRDSVLDLLLSTLDPDVLCLSHYLLGVDDIVIAQAQLSDAGTEKTTQ